MNKRPPICPTCKNQHPITKDGYEYLDCMLYIKQRDGKGKTSVEIWNKEKKSGLRVRVDYSLTEPSSFHSFLEINFPSL